MIDGGTVALLSIVPIWAITYDPTISFGTLLAIISIIGGIWAAAWKVYVAINGRLEKFEAVLANHAATLVSHAIQQEKQDDLLLRIVGDVRELIGRVEQRTQRREPDART